MQKTRARSTAERRGGSKRSSAPGADRTREEVSRVIRKAPIIDTLEDSEREALRRDLEAELKKARPARRRQRR